VLRHEFRPGKLVAGVFVAVAGVVYAGDAGGAWETPWFAVIPLVVGGLCLAAVAGLAGRSIRRRRGTGPPTPGTTPPPGTPTAGTP
jgi:drug/metabolite transporter (DMT)-like permease